MHTCRIAGPQRDELCGIAPDRDAADAGRRSPGRSRAISATMRNAIGLIAGPQYPPSVPAVDHRFRRHQIEINAGDRLQGIDQRHAVRAAPLRRLGRPRILVTFGVSFTMTGIRVCCLHHRVTISTYSGT